MSGPRMSLLDRAAWAVLALAVGACLFWIGWSMRDQLREKAAFVSPLQEREAYADPDEKGEVLIGAVGGWDTDRDELSGMELAAALVNARGGLLGRSVRLVPVEEEGGPADSLMAAQSLAQDPRVLAVLGHAESGPDHAVAALYRSLGILLVSTAPASAGGRQAQDGAFHLGLPLREMAEQCAGAAAGMARGQTVLVHAANGPGRAFAALLDSSLKRVGRRLVASVGYRVEEGHLVLAHRDLAPAIPARVDLVLVYGPTRDRAALAAACRFRWPDARLLVADGTFHGPKTLPAEPGAPPPPDFEQAFRERYGRSPESDAALGFDALAVLAQAVRQAGTLKREAVVQALSGLKAPACITGIRAFSPTGQAMRAAVALTEP